MINDIRLDLTIRLFSLAEAYRVELCQPGMINRSWLKPVSTAITAACHFCQLSLLAASKRIGGAGVSASMFYEPCLRTRV